jgi:CBS domain-containing membrane protein
MAMTNTEHPPAAGTALAIVAHGFEWELVLFVAGAVLFMLAVHRLLRRHLLDLF